MANVDNQSSDPYKAGSGSLSSEQESRSRRTFSSLGRDLLLGKTATRKPAPKTAISAKEIVNGLDRREIMLGSVATILASVLAALGYYSDSRSTNATVHANASDFFIAMIIAVFLLALGTAIRRRAMVGFAAFFFGLEQISFDSLFAGVLYLAFGAWLIWRVMQKSKSDSLTKATAASVATRTRTVGQAAKPSKRYTPPKTNRSKHGR